MYPYTLVPAHWKRNAGILLWSSSAQYMLSPKLCKKNLLAFIQMEFKVQTKSRLWDKHVETIIYSLSSGSQVSYLWPHLISSCTKPANNNLNHNFNGIYNLNFEITISGLNNVGIRNSQKLPELTTQPTFFIKTHTTGRERESIPSMNLRQELVLFSLVIFLIHVNLYKEYNKTMIKILSHMLKIRKEWMCLLKIF